MFLSINISINHVVYEPANHRKRKRKRVECNQSVQPGENKKKREREEVHLKIPNEEGKRRKTDGKDGCNQLGSSTHKGIS